MKENAQKLNMCILGSFKSSKMPLISLKYGANLTRSVDIDFYEARISYTFIFSSRNRTRNFYQINQIENSQLPLL